MPPAKSVPPDGETEDAEELPAWTSESVFEVLTDPSEKTRCMKAGVFTLLLRNLQLLSHRFGIGAAITVFDRHAECPLPNGQLALDKQSFTAALQASVQATSGECTVEELLAQHFTDNPRTRADVMIKSVFEDAFVRKLALVEPCVRRLFSLLLGRVNARMALGQRYMLSRSSCNSFLKSCGLQPTVTAEDIGVCYRTSSHSNTALPATEKEKQITEMSCGELMEFLARISLLQSFPDAAAATLGQDGDNRIDKSITNVERLELLDKFLGQYIDSCDSEEFDSKLCSSETMPIKLPAPVSITYVPSYDETFLELALLVQAYSDNSQTSSMQYPHPDLNEVPPIQLHNIYRLFRDAGMLDNDVNFSAIDATVSAVTGADILSDPLCEVEYEDFLEVVSRLAPLLYEGHSIMAALTFVLEDHLLTCAERPGPDSSLDFCFSQAVCQLWRTYSQTIRHLFTVYASNASDAASATGVSALSESLTGLLVTPRDEQANNTSMQSTSTPKRSIGMSSALSPYSAMRTPVASPSRVHSPSLTASGQTFSQHLAAATPPSSLRKPTQTLADLDIDLGNLAIFDRDAVAMCRDLGFIPSFVSPDQVSHLIYSIAPGIGSQEEGSSTCLSLPYFHIFLGGLALVAFTEEPWCNTYATPEERLLALTERIEIMYRVLFGKDCKLSKVKFVPLQETRCWNISDTGSLASHLTTRRLMLGRPLVLTDEDEQPPSDVGGGKTVHRGLRNQGQGNNITPRRRVQTGIPILIREQLLCPAREPRVQMMLETALLHGNNGRHKVAIETMLKAAAVWSNGGDLEPIDETYWWITVGELYFGANLDELALACFEEGRIACQKMRGEHPLLASALNCAGAVFFHQRQPTAALRFFTLARCIREDTLGPEHVDVAALLNNMAACMDCLGRSTEARDLFEAALNIVKASVGPGHPRYDVVRRNLGKVGMQPLDFEVSFEPLRAMPLPKGISLVMGKAGKKKKGAKKGGKKKKK